MVGAAVAGQSLRAIGLGACAKKVLPRTLLQTPPSQKARAPGWAKHPGPQYTYPLPLLRVLITSAAERRPSGEQAGQLRSSAFKRGRECKQRTNGRYPYGSALGRRSCRGRKARRTCPPRAAPPDVAQSLPDVRACSKLNACAWVTT